MNQLSPLTLESIAQVKGGIPARMLAKALERMAVDLESAPDINEWRTVTMEIAAKPTMESGQLSDVSVEIRVKGKVPVRSTSTVMQVRTNVQGQRQLMFNIDAQDNPRQTSFLPPVELPASSIPAIQPEMAIARAAGESAADPEEEDDDEIDTDEDDSEIDD